MRILVTGANGQVGWELSKRGAQQGFEMLTSDLEKLDITDCDAVKRTIREAAPSLVVNAAAYTAVDRAESEPDLANAVNRDGPGNLASACAEAGIPLIHISTDYVFDGGKTGPYVETDPVSPLGVYGRSKAAGEVEVRARLPEHIILRTAWLYGIHGQNFVKTILRLAGERETLRVVDDQYGCPTYAADLAEAIVTIAAFIRQGGEVFWGTYHYCGKGVTSWHAFAEAICDEARKHTSLKVREIVAIPTEEYPTPTKRPANSALDCSLLTKTFGIGTKPWHESLARMVTRLYQ
jgi:dTDP-4-dehydrorhamnose reductase